ncbi:MAG: hypothetical protein ACYSTY_07145 [Planctomycetota bacterium]
MLERQESQRDKPVIVHAVPRVLLAMVIAACTLATGETRAQAADVHSLDEAIVLATGYLARVCAPDGQFTYRINLDPQVTPAPRYNVLRHAGTTWSLVVAQQWRPDPDARAAAIRAAAFLRERCIAPVPGEEDLLAVWSDPELNRSGNLRQAKLGGTGLGLVALASLEAIEPGATPRDDLRSMGRFILSMQKPDGSFYSKFYPGKRGRDDSWTSLYYPGEAALGLLMLHDLDPDPRWFRGAADALAYLARKRRDQVRVPADHWALIATGKLLEVEHEGAAIDTALLIGHASQVCRSMLAEQRLSVPEPALVGAFGADGRTAPAATRLEGLQAALGFLPAEHAELRGRIETAVEAGIGFLLVAQIREGEHAGAVPRAAMRFPPGDARSGGNVNERATEVRIDYVQHALCAFIEASRRDPDADGAGQDPPPESR